MSEQGLRAERPDGLLVRLRVAPPAPERHEEAARRGSCEDCVGRCQRLRRPARENEEVAVGGWGLPCALKEVLDFGVREADCRRVTTQLLRVLVGTDPDLPVVAGSSTKCYCCTFIASAEPQTAAD